MKTRQIVYWAILGLVCLFGISIIISIFCNWKETNYLIILNHTVTITIAIIGGIITVTQLIKLVAETKERNLNEKRKYATDMIREWNINSVDSTGSILQNFPGYLESCEPIPIKIIKQIVCSKPEVDVAIRRLLNYFEYVATAYQNCADKNIIEKSFALTMTRYSRILQNYLLDKMKSCKRNHWLPFTEFVSEYILSKSLNCNMCPTMNICKLKYNENFKLAMDLLNKNNLTVYDNKKVEDLIT